MHVLKLSVARCKFLIVLRGLKVRFASLGEKHYAVVKSKTENKLPPVNHW